MAKSGCEARAFCLEYSRAFSSLSDEAACAEQSTDDETQSIRVRGRVLSMEKTEDFAKVLERLKLEYEELEALRAAADALRTFRVRRVDVRFD